jgi:hypothetical protein
MRRAIVAVTMAPIALGLAGCGAAAVIQGRAAENAQVKAQLAPRFAEVQRECNSELESRRLDPIRDKVKFTGTEPVPFRLLIISGTPTPPEKEAIVVWSDARADCAARLRQLFETMPLPASMPPEFQRQVRAGLAGFADRALQATNLLSAGLYDGRLTYREFNKERGEIVAKLTADLRHWVEAMDAEDRAQVVQRAEAAQREVDAAVTLVRVAACANARGRFARMMCE